ncbi:MAG: SDR family oxidoreductase [Thermomicrobiales bacterium]
MTESSRPVALVTGGSRGIGAATTVALAREGFDVAITYRNKAARAEEVATDASRFGAAVLPVGADVTKEEELTRLFVEIERWRGRLDLLVLNASGGLESDLVAADPRYPWRINRDAQLALVDHALPRLRRGSTIVFVTSHWAHLYRKVEQLPAYGPVAETKYAGEQALRARQSALADAGVRLIVVTGDLVDGTITAKLLERGAPGLAGSRRDSAGTLPTTINMAAAIVAAAQDRSLSSGHTVVVGGSLDSLPVR